MGTKDKTLFELLGEMQHVALSVKDTEEAVKYFSKMGVEFGDITIGERPDATLRGKPSPHRLKQAMSKNIKPNFQITQIWDGNSSQREFFETKGLGVHHICYNVDDLQETVAKFKELGIDVLQESKALGYCFMDTSKICGCVIEIVQRRR